ncbi:hypothetical protein [Pseudoduganella lutea]|uniref:Uncharacterized protein n=1 Tax=Pseudoduganella lutea TaxID=321985 RepID=A0A4P6L0R4_9BURK|nr:hypothetical protein [Pseudoduganella lutea]QBE65066.1 hypothetical protein EWM63_20435 [Pseudoduganella lutea]
MDLMIIRDIMWCNGKNLVGTGPLLLVDVVRQSDVQWLLGMNVSISGKNGRQSDVFVAGVSVRQTMSGVIEMSLGLESPAGELDILLDSVVTIDGRYL